MAGKMHYRRAAPNRGECACGAKFTEAHIKKVGGLGAKKKRKPAVKRKKK